MINSFSSGIFALDTTHVPAMEPESVLIVATVIIYVNIGIIIHAELSRAPTYDSLFNVRDILSRGEFIQNI